jgi:hypothetical protein
LNGKSSKNISMANLSILYKYLKQKKGGGCQDHIYSFSGFNDTAETNLMLFEREGQ